MSADIIIALISGQALLTIWTIIREVADRREKKKDKCNAKEQHNDDIHKMIFRLYKEDLKQHILDIYTKLEDASVDIRADLMELHDDMELYVRNGGNGTIKKLYIHLKQKVRDTRGEGYYALLYIESLASAEHHDD